jgi:hypothetical protein
MYSWPKKIFAVKSFIASDTLSAASFGSSILKPLFCAILNYTNVTFIKSGNLSIIIFYILNYLVLFLIVLTRVSSLLNSGSGELDNKLSSL